ncbi:SDR family NAD(P)-dependent oxidoreductase [Shimia sp. SDUM112013]|uniref:SDR family NAD(P)-dependent oxidoreductase n=1 Tax=Shimia sp. SDUM112013 TaxID=3136160 RepID=UPI0032EF91A1
MKTAVISGGNGGLGRALSAALQARGWRVVLLDLHTEGMEDTPTQIPITCDLTNPEALARATKAVLSRCESIDLVVYNAGITHLGAFDGLDEAALRKVFEINLFAAANMAQAFLQAVRDARGTHLAISSVAGFSPLYHRTAYAASKHALEGLFGSLRSEERPYGVRTIIAAPSFVATNTGHVPAGQDGTTRPGSASDGFDVMTPDEAAAVILKGLDKGRDFIPVGRVARLSYYINRLSPRLFQRLMEKNVKGH